MNGAADEQAWQRGMVFHQPPQFQQPNFSDPEAWDDGAILDVFDSAIRSHRTKGQPGGSSGKKGGKPAPTAAHTTKGAGTSPRKVAFDMSGSSHAPAPATDHPSSSATHASPPPLPPPPLHMHAQLDEAFNSMLMAWYHSGYATGRYQALLELSQQQQQQQPPASASSTDTRTEA